VVAVPGLALPLCFDVHGTPGRSLSLILDRKSGVAVSGLVTAALGRPRATYFTALYVRLGARGLLLTPRHVMAGCAGSMHHRHRHTVAAPPARQRRRRRRHMAPLKISRRLMHRRKAERRRQQKKQEALTLNEVENSGTEESLVEGNFFTAETGHKFSHEKLGSHSSFHPDISYQRHLPNCSVKMTWEEAAGRRLGDVTLTLQHRRRLGIVWGDVALHFAVVRSKSRGQRFLGFYVRDQNVLSPQTTGIIGQFAYKTVTLQKPNYSPTPAPITNTTTIPLLVLHVGEGGGGGARISQVSARVDARQSLLDDVSVPCLHVGRQGRGLLTRPPSGYDLPCLLC